MKLIAAPAFAKRYFDQCTRPSKTQVTDWLWKGAVPGVIIDGEPYVDEDAFLAGKSGQPAKIPSKVPKQLLNWLPA